MCSWGSTYCWYTPKNIFEIELYNGLVKTDLLLRDRPDRIKILHWVEAKAMFFSVSSWESSFTFSTRVSGNSNGFIISSMARNESDASRISSKHLLHSIDRELTCSLRIFISFWRWSCMKTSIHLAALTAKTTDA